MSGNLYRYSLSIGLGWGIAGPHISGIRRAARKHNVSLQPLGWAKLHEVVRRVDIIAEGSRDAVAAFAAELPKSYGIGSTVCVGVDDEPEGN